MHRKVFLRLMEVPQKFLSLFSGSSFAAICIQHGRRKNVLGNFLYWLFERPTTLYGLYRFAHCSHADRRLQRCFNTVVIHTWIRVSVCGTLRLLSVASASVSRILRTVFCLGENLCKPNRAFPVCLLLCVSILHHALYALLA